MTTIVNLLVTLLIAGLLFYAVVWLIGWIGLPDPIDKIIKAIVGIVLILYLLSVLTGYAPRLKFY